MGCDDRDKVKAASPILHSSKQLAACVSFPSLGELVSELLSNPGPVEFLDVMRKVESNFKKGKLLMFGHGTPDANCFELATALRREDHMIEVTDSLIVACAFIDPLCDVLYTFDGKIIESTLLAKKAKQHGTKIHPVPSPEI